MYLSVGYYLECWTLGFINDGIKNIKKMEANIVRIGENGHGNN